jgi:hypothetical protein
MPTLYGLMSNMATRYHKQRIAFLVATLSALIACEQDSLRNRGIVEPRNQPPETWFEQIEIDSLTFDFEYRIHFYWAGSDIDGQVSRYEYRITNTLGRYSWCSTGCTDSTFIFSREPHHGLCIHDTLWLRAVDDAGARDITPLNYPVPNQCSSMDEGMQQGRLMPRPQ